MANNSQLYLWNDRTLYIGSIPQRTNLCLGAACFAVFLDSTANVKGQQQRATAQTFLFPAASTIEIEKHQGRVAILMLDSLGYEYHALLGTMMHSKGGVAWRAVTEKAVVQTFKTIIRGNYGAKDLYFWMRSLTRPEDYVLQANYHHDPRVEKAMNLIKNYGDTPLDIMDCAQQIGMTVAELESFFYERTGLTLKGFRAWRLLGEALSYSAQGESVEVAAVKAGFADVEQYFKVFVHHFGMHPRALAKYAPGADIHVYKKPIDSEEPRETLYSAPDFFELG
ncbi:MAG: helix-turn-helix domain-containing protein [Pseudomonadales bacterium]|nr:helix-turn-helix domain-containing protein [Pseudomonadales bacterium]